MAAAPDTGVKSLQKTALDKIVKRLGGLGKSIACRFCCGSTLSSPDHVKLVYEDGDGFSSIIFPGSEQTAIQQLLRACSVSSFGIGSKEVTDLSYRNALKLQPDQFTTSFQLCNTPILGNIQRLMMPDMHGSIQAELYKLNIYSGPGGHFKVHVDTPRSSQMFGSLVVCLPTQFSGGALVTRHQGKEVRFDWSSSAHEPMQKVSWAAFFSDVEHEVLPVTDGHRLALTYNLYCVDNFQDVTPTLNITNSPFHHELHAAVSNPHFLRDGGVLGFSFQHQYVFRDLNCTKHLPSLLKGADSIVYMVGISLGLPVLVKPVTKDVDVYIHDEDERKTSRFILPKFRRLIVGGTRDSDDEPLDDEFFKHTFHGALRDKNITWCQALSNLQPAATYTAYGNEPGWSEIVYQAAAILVCVPKWGKRHTTLVEPQQCSCGEQPRRKKRKSDRNISAAFGGPDIQELLCPGSD